MLSPKLCHPLRVVFVLLSLSLIGLLPRTSIASSQTGASSSLYLPAVVTQQKLLAGDAQLADGDDGKSSLEWPQYQHDPRRTGYNPSPTPRHVFGEVWSRTFRQEGISGTTQPVIVGSAAYIGTERGLFYALHLQTGAELWKRQLDGPVTHTAAATGSAAYVGTLTGSVYALGRTDGRELWRLTTPESFGSAVLLVEDTDTLYLAGRLGTVYALDLATGAIRWQRDLGYPISHSPAFGDGRVFVGTEDMRLHALDAQSGSILWTSDQLYGRSFHDYAPVYAEGKVILQVMPDLYAYSIADLDIMKEANVEFSTTGALTEAQQATAQWLARNPKSQTMYVLDAATGEQPYRPGVLYTVVNSGAQPPPVFAKGDLYSAFHASAPMWLRSHGAWSAAVGGVFKDRSALGRLDLDSGRVVERLSSPPGEFTTDETNNYSGAGDLLFGARCQTRPSCTVFSGTEDSCHISQSLKWAFTSDLCHPGAAPVFANGHLLYQANNMLIAYR